MRPPILFTHHVEKLKQYAKKLKKEFGIPHHKALDLIAQQIHCHHWHHVTQLLSITEESEESYKNGLIVAFGFSEINDSATFFTEDNFVKSLILRERLEFDDNFIENIKSNNWINSHSNFSIYSDLDVEIIEYLNNFHYFKFTGKDIPKDFHKAIDVTRRDFFFPPRLVVLKGKFFDIHEILIIDSNNSIIGINYEFD